MSTNLKENICSVFGLTLAADLNLLEECGALCTAYNLQPWDLLQKWQAMNFRTSHSKIIPLTMDSIGALQRSLANEAINITRKKPPTNVNTSRDCLPNTGPLGARDTPNSAMPVVPCKSTVAFRGPKMDVSSVKSRSYTCLKKGESEAMVPPNNFQANIANLTASLVLDDRIGAFQALIRDHYAIPVLGGPWSPLDEEVTVVGCITYYSDSESSESVKQLTKESIQLQLSRVYGEVGSHPITLQFDTALKIRGGPQGAGGINFFPGAMVALKGNNNVDRSFFVKEILSIPPLQSPPSILGPSLNCAGLTPFSMCIVSGPYTPPDDLHYKPWWVLLEKLKVTKPAVILLIGPFVDVAHPKIRNGDTSFTPAGLFRSKIIDPLLAVLNLCPGSIAVIVPSVRDIISQQAVFPQSELKQDLSGTDMRIHMLPNPARFSINNITFAVTSVDVLFHLRKDQLFQRGTEVDSIPPLFPDDIGSDLLSNLCRHLLQQRSFYPVFPVPQGFSHHVNLDLSHSLPGLRLGAGCDPIGDNRAPDVLVLPSVLQKFSKIVHATICINPSFITKDKYAMLSVADKGMGKCMKECIQTEILKLK